MFRNTVQILGQRKVNVHPDRLWPTRFTIAVTAELFLPHGRFLWSFLAPVFFGLIISINKIFYRFAKRITLYRIIDYSVF